MRISSLAIAAVFCCLAAASPAKAVPSHIGPNTGVILPSAGTQEAQDAKGLNVGWASIYVDWAAHEPSPGDFQPNANDITTRLNKLTAAGLKVNVTFLNTPAWASGNPNPNYPPSDPQAFGNFVSQFAQAHGDKVDGYELGNEPDGGQFWLPGPDPAKYSGYAAAGLAAVAANDPTAVKFIGATAGANDEFMEEVLKTGISGWDAVAYHSGTACKTDPPGHYIREPSGNADIHNNSSTGYRELVHMMRSIGIANPVVADTAAGWSTTPALCDRGSSKDQKPGGVTPEQQSLFLRDSLGCAEQDPELKYFFIFSLYDVSNEGTWDHRMGLRNFDGSPKPAYDDLAATLAPGTPAPGYSPGGFCGGYVDHTGPAVTLTTAAPVVKGRPLFAGALNLSAKGTDEHPVTDIDLFADGKEIPTSTKDGAVSLDWQGAKDLALGEHTIIARARDEAGNTGEAPPLKVFKVKASELPGIVTKLTAKLKRLPGRKVRVTGSFSVPSGGGNPAGHIRMRFKKNRYVAKHSVKADPGRFRKTVKLKRRGRYVVRVFYKGVDPFGSSRAKRMTIRVR